MMTTLSEVILVFLRPMSKRTKPRHYQLHSGREICRSSPWQYCTVCQTRVRRRVWPPITTLLLQSLTQLPRKLLRQDVWTFLWQYLTTSFELKFFFICEGGQTELFCLPLPSQCWILSGWNTGCIPKRLSNLGNVFTNSATVGHKPAQDEWLSTKIPRHFYYIIVIKDLNELLDTEALLSPLSFIHVFIQSEEIIDSAAALWWLLWGMTENAYTVYGTARQGSHNIEIHTFIC